MMETIFRVGPKATWWRLLAPLFLACGALATWVGWSLLLDFALEPGGYGILEGLLASGVLLALGLGIAVGTCVYGQCYVSRIDVDREQDTVRIRLAGFIGERALDVRPGDIVSARSHDGYFDSGRTIVNAPWTTVRLRGRRLPLIVDDFDDFRDSKTVDRLLLYQTLAPEPEQERTPGPPQGKRSGRRKKRKKQG